MNSDRWTAAAIGYMCAFAYGVSLVVYQIGGILTGETALGAGTLAAAVVLACALWLLVRRPQDGDRLQNGVPPVRPGSRLKGGAAG